MVAIRIYDPREAELPPVGLMKVKDAETGNELWVDTSSRKVREHYAAWWAQTQQHALDAFNKSRVDAVTIATNEDFVPAMMNMFKQRGN
jgi:hypothetical protein